MGIWWFWVEDSFFNVGFRVYPALLPLHPKPSTCPYRGVLRWGSSLVRNVPPPWDQHRAQFLRYTSDPVNALVFR